jgi:ABC-type polysaccharide/polyol phosphate transport system ATPase subunit
MMFSLFALPAFGGFHPELTGRKNVFLNGAMLGMRRGEILRKFDEIVSFPEIAKFLDTPVKHYSSVMEVPANQQLAFNATIPYLMLKRGDYLIWVGVCSYREKEEMRAQADLSLLVKESRVSYPEGCIFWNSAESEVRPN